MPKFFSYNVLGSSIEATEITDGTITKEKLDSTFLKSDIIYPQAEAKIEIIELQAETSNTPIDHDSTFSDTFSDSTGYKDSVNAGNTTSSFQTDKFINNGSGGDETYNPAQFNNSSGSLVLTCNCSCVGIISSIRSELYNPSGTTYAGGHIDITDNSDNVLATKNLSGTAETITFSVSDYSRLLDNETFKIKFVKAGAMDYNWYSKTGTTYSGTNWNITNASPDHTPTAQSGTGTYTFTEIVGASNLVEIDLPTITGSVVSTMLIINGEDLNCYELEDGSSNIDTSLVINTENDLVNLTGNPEKLRLKFDSSALGYVKTFCLKLWKS